MQPQASQGENDHETTVSLEGPCKLVFTLGRDVYGLHCLQLSFSLLLFLGAHLSHERGCQESKVETDIFVCSLLEIVIER